MGKDYPGKALLHVITDEDMNILNSNDLIKNILESKQPRSYQSLQHFKGTM